MPGAGYSGTPLWKKLGIKPDDRIYVRNEPDDYLSLIAPVPDGVQFAKRLTGHLRLIHLFTRKRAELRKNLLRYKPRIDPDGMIWVSWHKKSSGVATEITEDTIREIALPMGLVDVKVCAVDETWSGLKLMIRKELRTKVLS